MPHRLLTQVLCLCMLAISGACTRTRYRQAADRDTYHVLAEKDACDPWQLPPGYAINPDPRSRFFDPTPSDCPQLPIPAPQLNAYALPPLQTMQQQNPLKPPPEEISSPELPPSDSAPDPANPAPPKPSDAPKTNSVPPPSGVPTESPGGEPRDKSTTAGIPPLQTTAQGVSTVSFVTQAPAPPTGAGDASKLPPPASSQSPAGATPAEASKPAADANPAPANNAPSLMRSAPIPPDAWNVLPPALVKRMLEFESMRRERQRSFPAERLKQSTAPEDHLTLANLMELATINSREYQTRKEVLYRAALVVTRQRYRYELRPIPFNNGTAVDYRHVRREGIEVNTLSIPSNVAVQQTLASGGEFFARFANSVVLTFNGPQGFATDIGSELLFDFQQTVFQRDIRFETLTQAERDVVYAARDYIRYRKLLFRDVANAYYTLLLNYRNIEINGQDYFTNLRGFLQGQSDYREAERIPRIQVDQFEQTVLRSRSNLVNNYFTLESSLDQMKFRLGLPPEMQFNLDLTELESLTSRDESSVARQLIERSRRELMRSRSSRNADAATLVNNSLVLADRMGNILRIQRQLMQSYPEAPEEQKAALSEQAIAAAERELAAEVRLLSILDSRLQVDFLREELSAQLQAQRPASAFNVFMRVSSLTGALLQLSDIVLTPPSDVPPSIISTMSGTPPEQGNKGGGRNQPELNAPQRTPNQTLPGQPLPPYLSPELRARHTALAKQFEELSNALDQMVARDPSTLPNSQQLNSIPKLVERAEELLKEVDALAAEVTKDVLPRERGAFEIKVQMTIDKTLELCDRLLAHGPSGWEEIIIDPNEAMLTALVQRLDLMNQRGDLADAWRQIKLAGDDLRSIVDLQATQTLRTRPGSDNPLDFSFDNSETRLTMSLDTPLNRRIQRNNYRIALINYNVGLRNLIAAEDAIKLDVREDLRQLQLDRDQYSIAIDSAALAYERVLSTKFRFALATQNVTARDFLEAQQAYTNALTTIARQHINYITDRTELFFDLEAFDVDALGHWAGVNQDYGPSINTNFPATNPRPYDRLPRRIWYSPTIRSMEKVPPGEAQVITHP